MAEQHATRFAELADCKLAAAVDVVPERLREFCQKYNIAHQFASVEEAIAWGEFDAVSVVTPDAAHASTALPCLAARLPVLCEKPLADSYERAAAMAHAAQQAGVINMVNLTYRRSGALQMARELVDADELGEIRHIDAAYRQSWLVSPYWGDWQTEDAWLWRLSTAHGSLGVLGDIGIHILDFATEGAGMGIEAVHCRLQTFDKAPGNRIGEFVLDANDSCVISAEFSNGALGTIHMSRFASGHQNTLELTLHGTRGALQITTNQQGDCLRCCIGEDLHTQTWKEHSLAQRPETYARFVNAVRSGNPGSPDFAHAAALQNLLERCFESHNTGRWQSVVKLRA